MLKISQPVQPETDISLSIGVIAWNEERAIVPLLKSLFGQTLFAELAKRNLNCEILCVANGCSDRTAIVASEVFEYHAREHPDRNQFICRVVDLPERGKLNAWNQFVHSISAREAKFLLLMDADIILHNPETLWNLLAALFDNPSASITVGTPRKDIFFKPKRSWRERMSLQASEITGSASAQLCAQLYCIRSEIARNIYLPKDLGACEDGFIKQVVCTDFLTQPATPERIHLANKAEHTFEAYTSLAAIFKNHKRQMIGQTLVHVLVDDYIRGLPLPEKLGLATTLREKDHKDPLWLKRLIRQHLQKKRYFWRLYPGLLVHRFKTLSKLSPSKRLKCLPAAVAGSSVAFVACWMAYRALRAGSTHYWPRAERAGLDRIETDRQNILGVQTNHP